jgi:hypothetical protein
VTTFYDDVTIAVGANSVQASAVGNVQAAVVFLGSYNGGVTGGGAAFIEGDHRPGNSPAVVNFGGDVFYGGGATLAIEIGGTAAGTGFDQVQVAGDLSLAGTLEVSLLGFAPAAGNSFDILNWTALIGTFDHVVLPVLAAGLTWNTSQLYTNGILSVAAGIAGDYNQNGVVDAADYVVWRKNNNTATTLPNDSTPGTDQTDYVVWRAHFGQTTPGAASGSLSDATVPEPTASVLLMFAAAGWCLRRGRAA